MCLSQKLYEIEKLHRDREITSTFYQQILAVTIDSVQSDDFNLTKRNPWFSSFLVSQQPSFKEILIGTTSSGISDQFRDIYSICRCLWNVEVEVFTLKALLSPP
jgi:hypothetical protein